MRPDLSQIMHQDAARRNAETRSVTTGMNEEAPLRAEQVTEYEGASMPGGVSEASTCITEVPMATPPAHWYPPGHRANHIAHAHEPRPEDGRYGVHPPDVVALREHGFSEETTEPMTNESVQTSLHNVSSPAVYDTHHRVIPAAPVTLGESEMHASVIQQQEMERLLWLYVHKF